MRTASKGSRRFGRGFAPNRKIQRLDHPHRSSDAARSGTARGFNRSCEAASGKNSRTFSLLARTFSLPVRLYLYLLAGIPYFRKREMFSLFGRMERVGVMSARFVSENRSRGNPRKPQPFSPDH